MNLKEKLFKMVNNAWYIVTIQNIINTVLMYLLHFEVLDFFGAKCSCLENPRGGGGWWAAIYEVAQSRTRLK